MTVVVWKIYHRPGWCQFFVYIAYVASFLSVWYVVCFTVERYLIIRCPLKRQELCRPGRAKAVVFSSAAVAFVLYNFAIWTSGVMPLSEFPFDRPFCQVRARVLLLHYALECKGNYSTISNNMKLVHWPLMGGLVTFGTARRELGGLQSPPRCTNYHYYCSAVLMWLLKG